MLVIFRLVLQDLWNFLVGECRALFMKTSVLTVPLVTPPEPLQIDRTSQQLAILPGVEKSSILPPVVPALLATVPTPLYLSEEKIETLPVISGLALDARVYYVRDTAGAVLLATPYVAYDGAVATVAYGAVVTVSQFVGNYAAVLVHGQTGYISKDSITPHRHDVWPLFVTGEQYNAPSLSTVQTRRIIQDEFLCGLIGLTLQASEYVLLRLHQDNITIPWSVPTNRLPGQWHTLLRGQAGVKNTIIPQNDSIIEWTAEDGIGRLGYVENVLPDQTIRLSAVGVVVAGEYTESLVPAAVWREWRPVFISFV